MDERISLLESKYKSLLNKDLYLNSISKHQAKRSFDCVLAAACACGTKTTRKNKFHKEVGFMKNWNGVSLFLDGFINSNYLDFKSDFNVALIQESKAIRPDLYRTIYELEKEFDLILTHDPEIIINFENKARYVPGDSITIGSQFHGVDKIKKIKDISFNFSDKLISPGHKLRHIISKKSFIKNNNLIDMLGSGPQGKYVEEKGEMLSPYKFSIIIENSCYEHYFTEKILDCFISGTVPIYWGSSSIGDFFDSEGILNFNSIVELEEYINDISKNPMEYYESIYSAVISNFSKAEKYLYYDDIYHLEILDFIDNKYGIDKKIDWFSLKKDCYFSNPNSLRRKISNTLKVN